MRNGIIRAISVAGLLAALANAGAASAADALESLPGHVAVNERLHVSGQPSREAIAGLRAAGVGTVINLRPPAEIPALDEKTLVEQSGISYRALPISGSTSLTRENVVAFDRLLAEAEAGPGKVLLHCASGNRVGALMALRARWLQGKGAQEAMRIGKASGLTGLAAEVQTLLDMPVSPVPRAAR